MSEEKASSLYQRMLKLHEEYGLDPGETEQSALAALDAALYERAELLRNALRP